MWLTYSFGFKVGECGVNLGGKIWELYCLEHGVSPDGYIYEGANNDIVLVPDDAAAMSAFFSDRDGKYYPRAIMADLDNDSCDNIRYGVNRALYSDDQIVSNGLGGGANFARGCFGAGKGMIDQTIDRIRKLVDECDNLQGFMVHHSTGGGTGSGFTALLMERLASIYDTKERVTVSVQPSVTFTSSVVEPYNHISSLHSLLEHAHSTIYFDNAGVYDICKRSLDIGTFSL